MSKYSNYNIIPIGDHCATAMLLKEMGIRRKGYPFDWVTKIEQLHDTNIIYNVELIDRLDNDTVENIARDYIGDAFQYKMKVNSKSNIWFAHETESIDETIQKYERRFNRLKEDMKEKNIFILLTRCYVIEEGIFQRLIEILLRHNSESIILFISGSNHSYLRDQKYEKVIFKHIPYDVSLFHDYDYISFRPAIKSLFKELFME